VRRERSILWLQYGTLKESYRELSGRHFHLFPAIDVKAEERPAVNDIYTCLHGTTWNKTKGWVGRPKSLLRPEIKVLEAEASVYQGLITGYHRKPPPPPPEPLQESGRSAWMNTLSAYYSDKSIKSSKKSVKKQLSFHQDEPEDLQSIGDDSVTLSVQTHHSLLSLTDIIAASVEGIDVRGEHYMHNNDNMKRPRYLL
jgi:hypothetical protein